MCVWVCVCVNVCACVFSEYKEKFQQHWCSDISKDEDCVCFPACNPAARLPPRFIICGQKWNGIKMLINVITNINNIIIINLDEIE